jgi:hypothetical protein
VSNQQRKAGNQKHKVGNRPPGGCVGVPADNGGGKGVGDTIVRGCVGVPADNGGGKDVGSPKRHPFGGLVCQHLFRTIGDEGKPRPYNPNVFILGGRKFGT